MAKACCCNFEAQLCRKALRVGKFLGNVQELCHVASNPDSAVLSTIANAGEGCYFFIDQFIWCALSEACLARHLDNIDGSAIRSHVVLPPTRTVQASSGAALMRAPQSSAQACMAHVIAAVDRRTSCVSTQPSCLRLQAGQGGGAAKAAGAAAQQMECLCRAGGLHWQHHVARSSAASP